MGYVQTNIIKIGKGELFVGMKITFGIMYRALFKGEMATVQYQKKSYQ